MTYLNICSSIPGACVYLSGTPKSGPDSRSCRLQVSNLVAHPATRNLFTPDVEFDAVSREKDPQIKRDLNYYFLPRPRTLNLPWSAEAQCGHVVIQNWHPGAGCNARWPGCGRPRHRAR